MHHWFCRLKVKDQGSFSRSQRSNLFAAFIVHVTNLTYTKLKVPADKGSENDNFHSTKD